MDLLRNLFKYGLPIVLSAWLCYYLYTKVDIEAMKEEISKCNYIWIGIALVISIFSHIFRAMRWSIQLNALNIRTPLNPLVWRKFGPTPTTGLSLSAKNILKPIRAFSTQSVRRGCGA